MYFLVNGSSTVGTGTRRLRYWGEPKGPSAGPLDHAPVSMGSVGRCTLDSDNSCLPIHPPTYPGTLGNNAGRNMCIVYKNAPMVLASPEERKPKTGSGVWGETQATAGGEENCAKQEFVLTGTASTLVDSSFGRKSGQPCRTPLEKTGGLQGGIRHGVWGDNPLRSSARLSATRVRTSEQLSDRAKSRKVRCASARIRLEGLSS